jgi:hypothetical protein
MTRKDATPPADEVRGLSERLCRISPTSMHDAARAARLLGTTAEQAAKALQALGVAAKKLEDESKALAEAHRARQPWWRRWRW